MYNLVLFGPPGSGKGTQSEIIKNKYLFTHISTGDIFRTEMSDNTELGILAKEYVKKGELVPDELVVKLVMKFIAQHTTSKGFIFDGFPRTIKQAEILRKFLFESGNAIKVMINLNVPADELIKRMINRGKLTNRPDDLDEKIIRNRLKVYKQNTEPVIDFYKQHHKHYVVDGLGDISEIASRIATIIEQFI